MRRASRSLPALALALLLALMVHQPLFAVTVTRGPFLQLQTPTSVSVVWFTDTACTGEVEWGATAAYGQLTPSPVAGTRHEIAVTGLSPDTLYHYRVRCEGTPLSGDATLRTSPPADSTAISFTFVGDSCSAPANCTATYNAMLPQSINGFCLTLGDLAGRGEDNITDYWQSHFFSPAANFIKHICMYTTVGNHELYDETATFVYPARYVENFSLPFAGSGTELYYSFDKGHVHFANVSTFWSPYTAGSAQHTWLAGDLASTDALWKIVFGHDGPYISEDGRSNGSTTMRTNLVPLFQQHGVDLYLHGHYHNYQRNVVDGVTYIDQGTGGQPWSSKHADDSQPYVRAFADRIYCFSRIDIDGLRLLGRCFRTSDGTVLDAYQMDKPAVSLPWRDLFPATGPDLNWAAPWNFASQCGLVARPGNPSGDGFVYEVANSSGDQYLFPMLADESMSDADIEADIYYDASSSVKNRYGLGLRGRLLFDAAQRSCYVLAMVRNDSLAPNGHAVLFVHQAGNETVLGSWPLEDVSAWHRLKLSSVNNELNVWIDGMLKTTLPVSNSDLRKGRSFVYNYRAAGGAKTLVDDVAITDAKAPAWPLLTDFEGYADGAQVMFRQPSFSGSTSMHLAASPDLARVVTEPAFGGSKVYQFDWAFADAAPQRWLRLTTSNAGSVPNPAVDLTKLIRLRCRLLTPGSLRVCLGIRETGLEVPIGTDGGKIGTIEWLGASAVEGDAPRGVLIADQGGAWQTLTFDPLTDPVQGFTGDGVLDPPHKKGVLEHLALSLVDGAGPFTLQLDLFEQPDRLPIPGDFDGDADVDLEDFGRFQICLGLPGEIPQNPACANASLDSDLDVDQTDLLLFQRCLAGPNRDVNPTCAD